MEGQYRYPGTQAFQADDVSIFYGRDDDIRHLLRMVRLEQLVILHGKSGLGKSSLINAGILPLLHEHRQTTAIDTEEEITGGFAVEEVRFGTFQTGEGEAPLAVLKKQIADDDLHPWLKHFLPGEDSLWLRCKSYQLKQQSKEDLLLVFDQFEELFTYPSEDIRAFKEALAGLLHTEIPTALRRSIREEQRKGDSTLSKEEQRKLLQPLAVKILFIVRSDRLSLLDQFTSHLPNILVNLYELHPLNRQQAKAAIVEPAAKQGDTFATPSFGFEESALQIILDGLSNDQQQIESFQLQLLCQYLENKVAQTPELRTIQEADFGGRAGIRDILHNYYERQLDALTPENRLIARRFIEEGLIVNENRIPVAAGVEKSRFGVSPELLEQLLTSRLIRVENIHLGKIYELSHDTLVEPVRRSYLKRQEEEERERIAQELAEERERLKKEQQARRRNQLIALLGFGLFALAAVAGIFALVKYRDAEVARLTAENNERRAAAAALAARAWEIYTYDHTLAARVAQAALQIDSESQDVVQTLERIVNSPNTSFYKKVLTAHDFEINQATFSSDGHYFATVSHDQKVILWDETGNVIHRYLGKLSGENQPGHSGPVRDVVFSPDGTALCSVGADGMVKVWHTQTGELIREWKAHDRPIEAVAQIPNSEWLVTASGDGTAIIWTMQGEKMGTLVGHQSGLTDVAASRDGKQLLTTSTDGTAKLWRLQGQLVRTFDNEGISINAGAFSPDGQFIALATSNKTADIWTIAGVKIRSLGGHKGQVVDVEYFPDGEYLLTSSEDATAKVWTPQGEEVLTLRGHRKRLNFAEVSPDGKTIITGGFDFTARLWDVAFNLNIQRHRHSDFIYGIDVSDDDQRIVTASKDFSAKVWNLQGQWLADLSKHTNVVISAFFIKGREEIITASWDGTVRIWDYLGKELLTIPHGVLVRFARATPGRERIISSTGDGKVFVWDHNGLLLKQWEAEPTGKSVNCIDIHPKGDQLLTVQGNSIKTWTLEGILIDSFVVETAPAVRKAFYSKDGNEIYTVANEYPIRKWSLDGKLLATFYGHAGENYWVAVHPEKDLLASASWDQTLKIWDTEGTLLASIPHKNGVYTVDFTSDGELLVSGGHDNIGRVWNRDGALVAALGERVNPVQILQSSEVSTLADIPFSVSEENIPESYLSVLAGANPKQYLREGEICVELGTKNEYTLEEKLAYFQQAIVYFQQAQALAPNDTSYQFNENIASTYQYKGEQLLIHRQYEAALVAFEQGLTYADLDYLVVLQTLANLYSGNFDRAAALVEIHRDRPMPQIEWYENYPEAMVGELAYFKVQFGITHPDAEKLEKLLQEPGSGQE